MSLAERRMGCAPERERDVLQREESGAGIEVPEKSRPTATWYNCHYGVRCGEGRNIKSGRGRLHGCVFTGRCVGRRN